MKIGTARQLKIFAAIAWLIAIVMAYRWAMSTGVPIRFLPKYAYEIILSYGMWGPIVIVGLYLVRAMFLIPTTALVLVSGSLYGPVWGTLLNLLGQNISAGSTFAVARFFGRRYVREHEHGWVRKYDELLTKEGFMTILMMRLLFFPFDVVNVLSSLTGVTYRQYAFATALGMIPATVTLTVLGGAFHDPRTLALFGALLVATIVSTVFLKRSTWVKEKLFAKRPEHVI